MQPNLGLVELPELEHFKALTLTAPHPCLTHFTMERKVRKKSPYSICKNCFPGHKMSVLKWSLIFVVKPSLPAADRPFDVQNVQVEISFLVRIFRNISSITKWAFDFSKSRPLMKFPAIMFWLVQGSVFTALEIIRLTLRNGSGRLLMSFFLTFFDRSV